MLIPVRPAAGTLLAKMADCRVRARNTERSVLWQDPKKFARGMQLLQLNEEIKSAKKVSAINLFHTC